MSRMRKLSWGVFILIATFALGGCGLIGGGETPPATSTPNLTLTAVFGQEVFPTEAIPTATAQPGVDTPQPGETQAAATPTPLLEEKGIYDEVVGGEQLPPLVVTQTVTPLALDYSSSATSTTTLARSGPSISAEFLDDPPTIDGDWGDWPGTVYAMDEIVYGPGYYANEADLFGEFKIAWDGQYLYVGVLVRDTKFVQNADGYYIYLGDSLEILLDADLAGDYTNDALNGDDFQVGFSPGDLTDAPVPEAYLWFPKEKSGPLPSALVVGRLTPDGYMMEVGLPWVQIGITPVNDQSFGFLFSVSDNDSVVANEQHTMISFAPGRRLLDPTTWRTLILVSP